MGKGSIYSTSSAQKLVGRSSTEDELIGVHDVLPQMLWTRYFLREQGFAVEKTILYQDNMSAMLLEKNGRVRLDRCSLCIVSEALLNEFKYFLVVHIIERMSVGGTGNEFLFN